MFTTFAVGLLALVPSVSSPPARLAPAPIPTTLAEDLTNLASTLECCSGKYVDPQEGTIKGWRWDAEAGEWKLGTYRGHATGAGENPPTGRIRLWPEAHGHDPSKPLSEQPDFLAEALRTLAHECLHFKCPPHAGPPPGVTMPEPPYNPDTPPTGEGRSPDCNDINYAIHTAAQLCAQICKIQDEGGPVNGSEGPVPGTDTPEGLCAYCKALKKAHEKIQERWNTESNAATAEECACPEDGDPWDPTDEGDQYSDCPKFPAPPGGCDGQPPYPDNKVIPDCDCECPCEDGDGQGTGSTGGF